MLIDLTKYREEKNPYTSEEEVWDSLINLDPENMMIITRTDGKLRVAKVRMSRFEINPEQLDKETK